MTAEDAAARWGTAGGGSPADVLAIAEWHWTRYLTTLDDEPSDGLDLFAVIGLCSFLRDADLVSGHPDLAGHLSNLGSALATVFRLTDDRHDFERALATTRAAVDLTPDDAGARSALCVPAVQLGRRAPGAVRVVRRGHGLDRRRRDRAACRG
ncbi:hypothetical protein [Amycolatopsis sp. CA-126428]|uniref:hypothetical protein n=1 Tax=Amycolatopsis sp. CA-126428 TaxID=2073158 RepID=UPI000CD1F402|nr:hypothetical protein [Amycolatopsis sp. CA-126428]